MIPRLATLALLVGVGCGDTVSARRSGLLGECAFNDECASPLVCAAARCRAPCRSDRDCANGGRCLSAGSTDVYVCYAPDDFANACVWDSHCRGGRVCGGDRVCRAQCRDDYDCAVIAPGLRCLAAGVCSAHPFLDDAGALADVDLNLRDARAVAPSPDAGGATDASSPGDGGSGAVADEPTAVATTGCGPSADARSCTPGAPGCDPVEMLQSREASSRCVRFSDGSVRCWGANYSGILGIGILGGAGCPTPFIAQRLHGAAQVVMAQGSGCGRYRRGVWCWGSNFQNNVGNGTSAASYLPSPIGEAPTGDGTLYAGAGNTTCLVTAAGALRCWGQNTNGELGQGDNAPRTAPVTVPLTDVVDVSPGETHVCAVRRDGTVWCWGANCAGETGSAPTTSPSFPYPTPCQRRVLSPQQVMGLSNARAVALGRYHSCALLATGAVWCWGWDASGELGRGAVGSYDATPAPVTGITDAVSLGAANGLGDCALRADRTVWCWGDSNRGATVTNRGMPTAVPGLSNVRGLARAATCATLDDRSVWCWSGYPGNGMNRYQEAPARVMF